METMHHKNAAAGRWFQFSACEQMANIWSEVGRTLQWKEKNESFSQEAAQRALELFDLTLEDSRWKNLGRLQEIGRVRELFCSAMLGENGYDTSLQDIENYLYLFALAARRNM